MRPENCGLCVPCAEDRFDECETFPKQTCPGGFCKDEMIWREELKKRDEEIKVLTRKILEQHAVALE